MRGTGRLGTIFFALIGITPAHAGNSGRRGRADAVNRDHPRACGEQAFVLLRSKNQLGSPPRMRGTVLRPGNVCVTCRITPAHAGNSAATGSWCRYLRDHPRACGEQYPLFDFTVVLVGSPPRMRGTALIFDGIKGKLRITPAHAGNSGKAWHHLHGRRDHPRACGEQGRRRCRATGWLGSPPRMRGTVKNSWSSE